MLNNVLVLSLICRKILNTTGFEELEDPVVAAILSSG